MSEVHVRVIARLQFETQAASEVIIDQAGRSFLCADGPAESTPSIIASPYFCNRPSEIVRD